MLNDIVVSSRLDPPPPKLIVFFSGLCDIEKGGGQPLVVNLPVPSLPTSVTRGPVKKWD